jgi:SLAP domain-containing protein
MKTKGTNGDGSVKIGKKETDAVNIKLSLNENESDRISDMQKDYLEEEMKEVIPQIEDGQVNVSGAYVFDEGNRLEVKIYIVNGLSTPINFDKVPFCIVNSKGEQLAYQIFELNEMGDIPPYSARPWKIYFDKKNVFVNEILKDDWKIVFDNKIKAVKYVNLELEQIPAEMEVKEVNTFKQFLNSLPRLEEGQVSISVFTITQYKNNNLLMTLMVRNAANRAIKLEKLPMTIKTSDGRIVLSGTFDLNDFEVNSHKARILSLVFEKELILDEEFDLSTCSVTFNRE